MKQYALSLEDRDRLAACLGLASTLASNDARKAALVAFWKDLGARMRFRWKTVKWVVKHDTFEAEDARDFPELGMYEILK